MLCALRFKDCVSLVIERCKTVESLDSERTLYPVVNRQPAPLGAAGLRVNTYDTWYWFVLSCCRNLVHYHLRIQLGVSGFDLIVLPCWPWSRPTFLGLDHGLMRICTCKVSERVRFSVGYPARDPELLQGDWFLTGFSRYPRRVRLSLMPLHVCFRQWFNDGIF